MLKDFPQPQDRRIQQAAAVHEAEQLVLSEEVFRGRERVRGITIDGSTSRDLDDAIWLREENGILIADISIADVATLIRPGSALYSEALLRGETRYHASGNDPMLPYMLSEDKLSLHEGQKRPTVTISIPLSPSFEAGRPTISPTYIESERKLSYVEADNAIKNPQDQHHEMLRTAAVVAQRLLEQRFEGGAMALFDISRGIRITEDGRVETIRPEERNIANIIIQEFMILANQSVAAYCAEEGIPILFRNHRVKDIAPARERILEDINQVLLDPNEGRIGTLKRRLGLILERANYGRVLEGHYALNLPAYARMTSPIRRGVDVVNWGQVLASLHGEPLPYTTADLDSIAEHFNGIERGLQDQRKEHFVEEEHRRVARSIDAGRFQGLDAHEFTRILVGAIREKNLPPDLEASILDRITSGQITANDAYTILLVPKQDENQGWSRITDETLAWIQRNPNQAVSILSQASSILGWKAAVFNTQQAGIGFRSVARVTVEDVGYTSDTKTARNRRSAEYDAAVDVLFKVLGLENIQQREPQKATLPATLVTPTNREQEDSKEQNFKGELGELRNQHHWRQEEYTTEQSGPPHMRVFRTRVKVRIGGQEHISDLGIGTTIKESEQAAAASLLQKLSEGGFQRQTGQEQSQLVVEKEQPIVRQAPEVNFKGVLQEASQQRGWQLPDYVVINQAGPSHLPTFTAVASMEINGKRIESDPSTGSSRRLAEQLAAENLLGKLAIPVKTTPQERIPVKAVVKDDNFVGALQELQAKNHAALPVYSFREMRTSSDGVVHCVCTIRGTDGKNRIYNAYGLTRTEAKQKAAELAFQELSTF